MSKIVAEDLAKVYRTSDRAETYALNGLNLAIDPGEFVCLLGPSGCGKSTFLNMVAGFLPITNGSIDMDGGPVGAPGPDRGVVFQEDALFPWLTAERNVAFGPRMRGIAPSRAIKMAHEALELVGLEGFERHLPKGMSGGMKQRVAIARILVNDPSIMLFDEPFSALDAFTRESLQGEMVKLWLSRGITVLFVTHNVEEAIILASRVVVMGTSPAGGVILEDLEIDLDRPRDTTSSEFNDYKRAVLETLNTRGKQAATVTGAN